MKNRGQLGHKSIIFLNKSATALNIQKLLNVYLFLSFQSLPVALYIITGRQCCSSCGEINEILSFRRRRRRQINRGPHIVSAPDTDTLSQNFSCFGHFASGFGIFWLIEKSGGLLDGFGGEVNSTGLQHLHCTSVHHCAPCRAGVRKICGFVVRPGRLRRRGGSPIRASLPSTRHRRVMEQTPAVRALKRAPSATVQKKDFIHTDKF